MINLTKIKPLSLAQTIYHLLETKEILVDYGDNILLSHRESDLVEIVRDLKKIIEKKKNEFFEFYKIILIELLDELLGLIKPKIQTLSYKKEVEIVENVKRIIRIIYTSNSYEEISSLANEFKANVLFSIYELIKGE
ncbi:MAG: hypothetical protein B6U78_03015 [Candidatus Aenigmarchaeota archaeon ex4484_224]|nr:MAG: hypothetical protein B6U78_03015 [Candidatus Aenigmarchaeota archaeon ex4484_224]